MKNFRRYVALFLSLLLMLGMFAGCGKKDDEGGSGSSRSSTKKAKNTYETPLQLKMENANAQSFEEFQSATFKLYGGQYGDEMDAAYKLLKEADFDVYFYEYGYNRSSVEKAIDQNKEKYGSNFVFYYEIEDKDTLDEDDLEEFQEWVREEADNLYDAYLNSDAQNIADAWNSHLSEDDAEDFIQIYLDIAKELKSSNVTEGYNLNVTYYVKGSELDKPKELNNEIIAVYKLNGVWVSEDGLPFRDYYYGF